MDGVNSTPTMEYVQSCTQHNQISSREHAWLKMRIAHLCVLKNNCHPRVMSHLPLFTSSPVFPLTSQTPTVLLEHDGHSGPDERSHCDDLRQSVGCTQTVTPAGDEPKSIETKVIETQAINPEDLEPRRIELDRNLGTDPYQIQERFMRNSVTEDVDEFGKSWCRDVLPPVTDAFRLWLTGGHCRLGSWGWRITIMLAAPLYRQNREDCQTSRISTAPGNLLQWYRREEQVQSVLKLITREEKAWRQVHLRNREQWRNLLQCFRQEMRNREINSRVLFCWDTHTVFRPLLILPVVICLSPVWLTVVSVLISFQSSLSVHLIILSTHSRWLKVLCWEKGTCACAIVEYIWTYFRKRWSVKSGKISSWRQKRSLAQSSKVWTYETGTSSWISQSFHQWATATSLCSKVEITGRTTLIHWISTRTRSSSRRIIYEGKRFSEILKSEVCTKSEKWRELKNYELTKSQCTNEDKIMRQY